MNALPLILAALALAAQAPPAAPKDRVFLKKGAPVEGTIQKDTSKEVVISGTAGPQTLKAEEVLRVEYSDAPPAFRGAMVALEQEKWSDALNSLRSAEELFNSKEKTITKPRAAWFLPYLAYYRGVCLLQLGRSADAIVQFDKIRKEFKESRFLPEAYELTLQAHRERADVAAMDAFEQEIEQAPPEIRNELKARAKKQRAELLLDKNKYAEARKLFEEIALSPNPDTAADGTIGVIRTLRGMKDASALEAYCKKVLATAAQPALLLIASNAIGDDLFEKKQFAPARDAYIQSVVRFNPGRTGTGAERDHETALYQLARCYEELMKAAKDGKDDIARMCSSAYRELSIEYPSGKYREEAAGKALRYEPKEEKKPEKK
jgi:tetratricopeptide (TPR) repeat protein